MVHKAGAMLLWLPVQAIELNFYDQSYNLEVPHECDKLCQFLFALRLDFSFVVDLQYKGTLCLLF